MKPCSMRVFCSQEADQCRVCASRSPHKPSVLARQWQITTAVSFFTTLSPLNEGLTSAVELQLKEAVLLNVLSFTVLLAGDNWIGILIVDVLISLQIGAWH